MVPEKDIRHDAPIRSQSTTATVRKVELILAASAEFERVVRQLPVDSWDLPTPSQISVLDLVEHVVVGNRCTSLLLAGVGREQARNMLADDQLGDDPVAAVAESSRHQAEPSPPATSLPRHSSGSGSSTLWSTRGASSVRRVSMKLLNRLWSPGCRVWSNHI